jgi:hypothetical protein
MSGIGHEALPSDADLAAAAAAIFQDEMAPNGWRAHKRPRARIALGKDAAPAYGPMLTVTAYELEEVRTGGALQGRNWRSPPPRGLRWGARSGGGKAGVR